MSHNALTANGKASIALTDLAPGTPALNDCVKVVNGAWVVGAQPAQKNEYAVASFGSTSTAAFTPSGLYGNGGSNPLRYLYNPIKHPGLRVAVYEAGVTYDSSLSTYWAINSSLPGWYICTATLNIGGGASRVAFQWDLGGPWVYLTGSTSAFKMSPTLRTVVYLPAGFASRRNILVRTPRLSNGPANTAKTATISLDFTRIN